MRDCFDLVDPEQLGVERHEGMALDPLVSPDDVGLVQVPDPAREVRFGGEGAGGAGGEIEQLHRCRGWLTMAVRN